MASVIDPRWTTFSERGFKCSSCEEIHKGVFDLACFRPESWPGAESYEPNSALRLDADFLSEDFCVIEGKHFLVRGVLEISVHGTGGETFGYGAWSTLSKENFKKYLQEFDSGGVGGTEWFGWFSNRLKGYPDSYALPCTVVTRPSRSRPKFVLENGGHPLVREQEAGISFDRLLEIYELHSHRFERL
jgi:hypothetical protein